MFNIRLTPIKVKIPMAQKASSVFFSSVKASLAFPSNNTKKSKLLLFISYKEYIEL